MAVGAACRPSLANSPAAPRRRYASRIAARSVHYHHPEQMTTRLSAEEIVLCSDLEVDPVEFEVSIADEIGLAAQARTTNRVQRWAKRLADAVAQRCRGSRTGSVVLRPGFETNETDLCLIINKLFFEQGERCRLCGGPLDLSEPPNRLAQPSTDRIDSSVKVYDRTNLQITHLACNLGKNEFPNAALVLQFMVR